MKLLPVALGLLVIGIGAGCLEPSNGSNRDSGPLFRYHFAGRAGLVDGTNASRVKEIEALRPTADLRAYLAEKLSEAVFSFSRKSLPAGSVGHPELLRPLFQDFLTAEGYVEVGGPANQVEMAVALELPDDRARVWSTNLSKLTAEWKLGLPTAVDLGGVNGWVAGRHEPQAVFQYYRVGKWIVLGVGRDRCALASALLKQIPQTGRPVPSLAKSLLDLKIDFPRLGKWCPAFARFPLPSAHLTMAGNGERLRTEVRFQYVDKVPWTYETWHIPTNIVGDLPSAPLQSFTLAQGIAPFLNELKGFRQLDWRPPTQFCAWGIAHEQCRVYFTVPVPNSTNAIRRLAPTWPRAMRFYFPQSLGDFLYFTNRAELAWGNLPFIFPHLRPVTDSGTEYLQAGIFPLPVKHAPLPDELLTQVRGRTNLVYYDWEITEHRLKHARQLYQLASIAGQLQIGSTNTPAQRWLTAIGPKLGNTVTEITQTGPRELTLVRRSDIGFTGFELATLSLWLDSPEFPFRLQLPPPLRRPGANGPSAKKP